MATAAPRKKTATNGSRAKPSAQAAQPSRLDRFKLKASEAISAGEAKLHEGSKVLEQGVHTAAEATAAALKTSESLAHEGLKRGEAFLAKTQKHIETHPLKSVGVAAAAGALWAAVRRAGK